MIDTDLTGWTHQEIWLAECKASTRNLMAVQFLARAADDYMACRTCILCNQLAGLQLGAQGIEKQLKGMMLAIDPSLRWKSHDLVKLAEQASNLGIPLKLSEIVGDLDRFRVHYNNRYPLYTNGSNGFPDGRFWDQLLLLDRTMVALADIPVIPILWGRVGVHGFLNRRIWNEISPSPTPIWLLDEWLIKENAALEEAWPNLHPRLVQRLSK